MKNLPFALIAIFFTFFQSTAQIELIGQDTIIIPCPSTSYTSEGYKLEPLETGGTWEDYSETHYLTEISSDGWFSLRDHNKRREFHSLIYKKTINQTEYSDTVVVQFQNRNNYILHVEPDYSPLCGDTLKFSFTPAVDSIVFRDGIHRESPFVIPNNRAIYLKGYVNGCSLDYGNKNSFYDSIQIGARGRLDTINIHYPIGADAASQWANNELEAITPRNLQDSWRIPLADSVTYYFEANVVKAVIPLTYHYSLYDQYFTLLANIQGGNYYSTYIDSSLTYSNAIQIEDCFQDINIYLRKRISTNGNSDISLTINGASRSANESCAGLPIENRRVILSDLNRNFVADDTTDVNGQVNFRNIAGGEYLILEDDLSINNQNPPQISLGENENYTAEFGRNEGELVSCEIITNHNEIVSENNFKVYPNPSNGIITFTQNFETVNVYAFDGKLVFQSNNETNNTIDLSNIPAGVYLIEGISNGQKFTSKLVLK